jgi:hypothetical protein
METQNKKREQYKGKMDLDEQDLLSTNTFIPKPDLTTNNGVKSNDDFKKFYESRQSDLTRQKVSTAVTTTTRSSIIGPDTEDPFLNSNRFQPGKTIDPGVSNYDRFTRNVVTYVNIDSRDRDKTLYPKPNHFKIFLGKSFYNVKTVKLASIEFPNTYAVINSTNNQIFWRNQEDIIDDFTVTTESNLNYPVYSASLRIGSYVASTLGTEITSKLDAIRRKQGVSNGNNVLGDFHYFVVSLDISTDIVTFTSLVLQQLPNNPLSTSTGSGVITVNAPSHGYSNNEIIYLVSPKTTAGISSSVLEGFQRITVINNNTFTFEVNIKAGETVLGGGNTVQAGKKAPFQLLWGEHSGTVAQNIGFPLENSSEQIVTYISRIENIKQMMISVSQLHLLLRTYDYIGQAISVGFLIDSADPTTFVSFQSFQIFDIVSPTALLVLVSSDNVITDLETGGVNASQATYIKFGTNVALPVSSYSKYVINTFLVTTNSSHNYTLANIGDNVTLQNTVDPTVVNDADYDGTYKILEVPSSTTFTLSGVLNSTKIGLGSISRYNLLQTHTAVISNVIPNVITISNQVYSRIEVIGYHGLQVGDKVGFNGLTTNPQIPSSLTISAVESDTSFLIPYSFSSVDTQNINNGTAIIGTGIIKVSFPAHGFNQIVNVSSGGSGQVIIQTKVAHGFSTGSSIRLSGTNTTPSLDGFYTSIVYLSPDTFSITSTLPTIPANLVGILGLSNNFYLYAAETLGGIQALNINNIQFTVRDIIDSDNFTFYIPEVYATFTESGGGTNVYISSNYHGFNGVQQNTKNSLLNRSINLEGENYSFLTCPQLATMMNTGTVKDIFARITLDQSPGYVCFNFLSNPKNFDTVPLEKLTELEFGVVNYDSTLYEFNDLDFSMTLEITEVIDGTDAFNVSSKRGIVDVKRN